MAEYNVKVSDCRDVPVDWHGMVVFVVPDKSDPEVEEVYDLLQRTMRENLGPGRNLQGGPTYSLRDYIRLIRDECPRAFGELLREANS